MNLREGEWIIVRHSDPFVDEPHQVGGTIKTIRPSPLTLMDKLFKRHPVDMVIRTDSPLGTILVKRVTDETVSLVLDPYTTTL